jgi:TrmH family RNA methyltransferase
MPLQHLHQLAVAGPRHPLVRAYLHARRRGRPPAGASSVALEGYWAARAAIAASRPLEALFVVPSLVRDDRVLALAAEVADGGAPLLRVGETLFRRMVDRDGPDGLAALVRWRSWSWSDVAVTPQARVLVADRPGSPGNVGSMIRCAEGAGASGVVLADSVLATASHAVVKASMGTIFTVPTVAATAADARGWLRRHRFRTVAASPTATRSYREAVYGPPVAIVVGNERQGLSPEWSRFADVRVSIPMHGNADSLNVATAAALLLYEAMHAPPA